MAGVFALPVQLTKYLLQIFLGELIAEIDDVHDCEGASIADGQLYTSFKRSMIKFDPECL